MEEHPRPSTEIEDCPASGVTRVTPSLLERVIGAIGSSRFALVLVGVLALFTLAGSVIPQQGVMDPLSVTTWRERFASIDGGVEALGLYHVFSSVPFLATVLLFAINTLVCTVLRYVREGGVDGIRRGGLARRGGFYVLHLALVALIIGGFWTFATQMNAYVIITEGQTIRESRDAYGVITTGPLREEGHKEFELRLDAVEVELVGDVHRVGVTSRFTIFDEDGAERARTCAFNTPLVEQGVAFVQDEIGFAPRMEIRAVGARRPQVSSFLALKTEQTAEGREHRDFLPLPFLPHPVIVRLIPDADASGRPLDRGGDRLGTPMLALETMDDAGETQLVEVVASGDWAQVGDFEFRFLDVRRWSAFRVREDHGYPLVWLSLWLALAAMLLRYSPDMIEWMRETEEDVEGASHDD